MIGPTAEGRAHRAAAGAATVTASPGRTLATAALLLLAYAAVQVAVNGIVLDETVIAAQIIAGITRSEAGHPHAIFYPRVFSVAHYASAGLMALGLSAEFVSVLRNILFLFMSTFTAFASAYVLTRRAMWGWVAVALVVAEANLRFAGLYPMWTFPNSYSNGHIGLQASVLGAALLVGGMWRGAGLVLGLLPGLHAAYALMVWPWALLFVLARRVFADRPAIRSLLLYGGIGVAICAVTFVLTRVMSDARPPIAPYDVVANGDVIREQFRLWTDNHRQPIPLRGFGYMATGGVFVSLVVLLWSRARSGSGPGADSPGSAAAAADSREGVVRSWQVGWFAGLGVLALAWVYGTRIWQMFLPLPDTLLITMPSRFSDIPATMVVALVAAAIASAMAVMDARKRVVVVAMLAVLLVVAGVLVANLAGARTRPLASRNIFFLVMGIALGCHWAIASGRQRGIVATCIAIAAGVLLYYWNSTRLVAYLGSATLGTAILLAWSARWTRLGPLLATRVDAIGASRLVTPGVLLLCVAALPGRTADSIAPQYTRWDMQSAETRAMGEWLQRNARPDEPVLTGIAPASELQVKTGQPILFEHKTLWIMSYMPELAPVIGTMAKDLYGVDYGDPASLAEACDGGRIGVWCSAWTGEWEARSLEDWLALGAKYRFRLVLAASNVNVRLHAVVTGPRWTLYTMEEGEGGGTMGGGN